MSFTAKFLKSDIYHITCKDDDERLIQIYIKVSPHKKPLLEKQMQDKQTKVDFSQFGEIIASCYGMFATSDVRQLLKEKYDIDV
jgi:hypothetical protein